MFKFRKHLGKFKETDGITEAHQETIQSSYEAKYTNIDYAETEEIRKRAKRKKQLNSIELIENNYMQKKRQ